MKITAQIKFKQPRPKRKIKFADITTVEFGEASKDQMLMFRVMRVSADEGVYGEVRSSELNVEEMRAT